MINDYRNKIKGPYEFYFNVKFKGIEGNLKQVKDKFGSKK